MGPPTLLVHRTLVSVSYRHIIVVSNKSPILKAIMTRINSKLINYVKSSINLREHCPPESVYRHIRKSLTQLKRPLAGILPGNAAVSISGSSRIASLSKESAERGFTLNAASAVPLPEVSTVQGKWVGFSQWCPPLR
jgi:hypothetical protein